MKSSSIYLITCDLPTGRRLFYVGQSTRPSVRWSRHKFLLKTGAHHNARVQAVYDKYGHDAFSFEVLETGSETAIDELEQWWLDEMHGWRCCLNIARDAKAPARGFKFTAEMIEKAKRNRPQQVFTDEMRKQNSDRWKGEKGFWFGKTLPPDAKKKISESKTGMKNHFYGKSGGSSPVARKVIGTSLSDGSTISFDAIVDCKKYGFTPSCVSSSCSGSKKTHKGYSWRYVD